VARQFRCKSCGRKLLIPNGFGARRARCPSCHAVFTVPPYVQESEAEPEPAELADDVGFPPFPEEDASEPRADRGPRAHLPASVRGLLRDDEQIVYWGRPSWAVLALALAVLAIEALLVGIPLVKVISIVTSAASVPAVLSVSIVLAVAAIGLGLFLGWHRALYVLTSHRLLTRGGVFTTQVISLPLVKVRGVSLRRGFVQKLLGLGSLCIYVS